MDTKNITAGSVASRSHSAECRTEVFAYFSSNGTLMVCRTEVWLAGDGVLGGFFFSI